MTLVTADLAQCYPNLGLALTLEMVLPRITTTLQQKTEDRVEEKRDK